MSFRTETDGWVCWEGETEASWLDLNGHVNFKRYFGLVSAATDVLMEEILSGGTVAAAPRLWFTLEARIRYAAELKAGERIRVVVRPLEHTEKTVRVLVRILRTEPGAALSAECEWTGAYIDPASRRVIPLPGAARAAFDAGLASIHGEPYSPPDYPTGFELPPLPPERRLQTSSGTIPRDAIDRMGHVGLEQYMYIFMLSNIGFMNALGMDRRLMMERRWGKFVLGSRIRYLAELCEKDRYRIETRMLWVRRKTCAYHHELYRIRDGEEKLAGTCTNTMAIADLNERRIIPLPEFMLEGIERVHGVNVPVEALL